MEEERAAKQNPVIEGVLMSFKRELREKQAGRI